MIDRLLNKKAKKEVAAVLICAKCGAELDGDVKVCPACGADLEADKKYDAVADESYDEQDVEANKIYSILAYMGFLTLVPLFAAKDSKYAKFHTNQGLILLICELIAAVISTVLWFIPVVGTVLSLVIGLPLYLVTVILMVVGILNAYKGEAKQLPVIGQFELIK